MYVMKTEWLFLVVFLIYVTSSWCQVNADSNVAPNLMECYNNTALPGITIANERPPATMNILIEYIQKLEDANPTMSPSQLSYQIMQRIRQDGIARSDRPVDEHFAIPYASSRLERYKFGILLTDLLPKIQEPLDYGELTSIEKCSLHFMISNTIDELRRDSEPSDCSQSSRYTSRISRRDVKNQEDLDSTELISSGVASNVLSANFAGNLSQCPIELGVVYSPFGTIKAGDVLAGIATGFTFETYKNNDKIYAATIVGELCEASLYQASQNVALGASGGWNSTINPKYFFLQNNNNLQATDAELRGGVDGLLMGLKLNTWLSEFIDLKISQLFDMYYSQYEKGVLDTSFKACNRNLLYTEMTSSETMRAQLTKFMPALNVAAPSGASLSKESFEIISNAGVDAFDRYLPKIAQSDLGCKGLPTIERVAANLHIIIDSSWAYRSVQPILSYVLNNIDVSKFGTKYTLYSGSSLRNLTGYGTVSLSEFYIKYNQSIHSNETRGFDYIKIFEMIESLGRSELNNNTYNGGESTLVLLIPKTTMNNEQRSFVSQRKEIISRSFPDVHIFVMGSGTQSDYDAIVMNTNKEVIILEEATNEETLKDFGQKLVKIIKDVPRAVINPSCTSLFTGESSAFTLNQYVELQGTNYYRISPNYFASGGDTRNLIIREQGYGSISVCLSRDNIKPDNSSPNCRAISNKDYIVEISSYCDGSVSSCLPIFISVSGNRSDLRCTDTLCRFPNDIKFTITLENVGCVSSDSILQHSFNIITVFLTYLIIRLF